MGVLKYIFIVLFISLSAHSKDVFLVSSFGKTESGKTLSSFKFQKNISLLNRINLSFGLSATQSLGEYKYSNSNKNVASSSFLGLEFNLFRKNFKRQIIKQFTIVENKIVMKKIIKNHHMNKNNGLYLGYSIHSNNFFSGDNEYGVEYLLFYEFQRLAFKKRIRIGVKNQSIDTRSIKYNLSQFFIGVSFD